MRSTVTLVGSIDRDLVAALRDRGFRAHDSRPSRMLASAHPPGSKGPDAFVVDIREPGAPAARARPALKRQFPRAGHRRASPRRSTPTAMLEAMRMGVSEWVPEPLVLGRPRSRACSAWPAPVAEHGAGPAVRGARRQGRRRLHDRGGQPGDRAPQRHAASRRCSSTCTWRTATPRCSSASSRASRWSTRSRTSTGSTRPTSRAWSRRRKAGLDLLASANRPHAGLDRRAAGRSAASSSSTTAYPLGGARLPAHRRRRVIDALDAASTIVVVANQELADAAQRQPAGGDAAPAVRHAPRQAGDQPLRRRVRDRPQGRRAGARRRRSTTRSRATTAPRSRRSTRASRWCCQTARAPGGERSTSWPATWPGWRPAAARQRVKPRAASAGSAAGADRSRTRHGDPEPFTRRLPAARSTSARRTTRTARSASTARCSTG